MRVEILGGLQGLSSCYRFLKNLNWCIVQVPMSAGNLLFQLAEMGSNSTLKLCGPL